MELRILSTEQLSFEFLKAHKAYTLVTFKRDPLVYMQDDSFNAIRYHLDAVLEELKRRRDGG